MSEEPKKLGNRPLPIRTPKAIDDVVLENAKRTARGFMRIINSDKIGLQTRLQEPTPLEKAFVQDLLREREDPQGSGRGMGGAAFRPSRTSKT